MSGRKPDPIQEEFCFRYALLGDPVEAAMRSGFDPESALRDGIACLKNPACQKKIREIRDLLSDCAVLSGLRRLAFGSCKDAVVLAFSEELPPPEVIEKLDLFNVSEIKRVKGGGVEIKLFDRLKALEKLYELECSAGDHGNALGLMDALLRSAKEVDNNADMPPV